MEERISRTIIISGTYTGLSLPIEHKVKIVKVPKYEAAEQEIEDNPVWHVKVRFSMLFIINSFNQIEIEDLPPLNHNDDHKYQKRSN